MKPSDVQVEIPAGPLTPGAPFTGRIRIRSSKPWEARRLGVLLEWTASNDHTAKGEEAAWQELARPGTTIPAHADYEFRLLAPVMPWSHDGIEVRVEWTLSVIVKPRRGKALLRTIPVRIRPPID